MKVERVETKMNTMHKTHGHIKTGVVNKLPASLKKNTASIS